MIIIVMMLSHSYFIETYPLRGFNIINGTESSPSVQCFFTDDVMIANNYSTGCLAYYHTNMDQAVNVPRKDYASNATRNIADITISGYYNINVISLPSPGHHLDSVYISVEPSEYALLF